MMDEDLWAFDDETLEHWGNRLMDLRLELVAQENTKEPEDRMTTRQITGKALVITVRDLLTWIFEADTEASESDPPDLPADPS